MRDAVIVLQKILKLLHQLGSAGAIGSLAVVLMLGAWVVHRSAPEQSAASQLVMLILQKALLPSLAVVLISGLLAIAASPPYMNAGWVWVKALLGLAVFEAAFAASGGARRAAELYALPPASASQSAELAHVLQAERGTLWVLLVIGVINVGLAVWRPRMPRWMG